MAAKAVMIRRLTRVEIEDQPRLEKCLIQLTQVMLLHNIGLAILPVVVHARQNFLESCGERHVPIKDGRFEGGGVGLVTALGDTLKIGFL